MTKQIKPCSCGKPRTKDWHLACPDCWSIIPTSQQNEVFWLFKTERGSNRHIAAVRRCYEVIRASREQSAHHFSQNDQADSSRSGD
jgi:hypothetical protein